MTSSAAAERVSGAGESRLDEIGRELAVAVTLRGAAGVAEIAGRPFSTSMIPDRATRRAVEALIECARNGELPHDRPALPAEVGAAVARRHGRDLGEEIRATLEDLHECAPGNVLAQPGLIGEYVEVLADEHANAERPAGDSSTLLDAAGIFEPVPPISYTLRDLDIAPGPPTLVAGYGFSGKTLALQDAALAVASGTLAWGRFPVRGGRVLHLDYEQGSHLTCSRYQRLARARGIDPRHLQGRLALAVLPRWSLDTDAGADEAARLAEGFDLGLVDSFRAACPQTDENSSEARVPLDRLNWISEATGITWVIIHHARKPSQNAQGGARMAIRGSGALYDASGSVLIFGGEKGEPVTVEHEKAKFSGRTHDPFRLWIEDVELDGNPTAGLRVSYLDATAAQGGDCASSLADAKGRILELVRAEGSAGSANEIATRLGMRKADVSAAIRGLVSGGTLKKGGTYHHPVHTLTGTDGDSQ